MHPNAYRSRVVLDRRLHMLFPYTCTAVAYRILEAGIRLSGSNTWQHAGMRVEDTDAVTQFAVTQSYTYTHSEPASSQMGPQGTSMADTYSCKAVCIISNTMMCWEAILYRLLVGLDRQI